MELAVLIAAAIIVFGVMGVFFRRAVSGKWREAADTIGFTQQYYTPD